MAYPVTDAGFDTPSYRQFAGGPWLTRQAMRWFWDAYAPDVSVRSKSTASPLRASVEELRGLRPALLISGENDVLRDEGEAYAHRLMGAGVMVIATRYLGTIHDFLLLNPIADPQHAPRLPRSPTPCGPCSSPIGSRRRTSVPPRLPSASPGHAAQGALPSRLFIVTLVYLFIFLLFYRSIDL
jgi:acetyl esterase/lipase